MGKFNININIYVNFRKDYVLVKNKKKIYYKNAFEFVNVMLE